MSIPTYEPNPADTEVWLRSPNLRRRYNCSEMWIDRRLKDSDFPRPVYFGRLRHWRLRDLIAWEQRQSAEQTTAA